MIISKILKSPFIVIAFLTLNTISYGQNLIIFTANDTVSTVLSDFNNNIIPKLKIISENTNSKFSIYRLEEGIPKEIKALPTIAFVNKENKLSFYKSAYGSAQRIKNFILQSQFFNSDYTSFSKNEVFHRSINNFEEGLNIKITRLKGLNNIDEIELRKDIINGIKKEFRSFDYSVNHQFKGWNKQFYINIYPYKESENKFYISYELFSQNNCHIPIIPLPKKPFSGKTPNQTAKKLGKWLNDNWSLIHSDTSYKDGLYIIKSKKVKTWNELGYELKIDNKKEIKTTSISFPEGSYTLEKEKLITFTFAPPADAYSGTITQFDGNFQYSKNILKGEFIVSLASLDSGDEDLNNSIKEDQFKIDLFPKSTLTVEHKIDKIRYNEKITVPATLNFLNQKQEVILDLVFESTDSENIHLINTDFIINISPFDQLEKPPYEAPVKNQVHVHVVFKATVKN